ncbi:MAG: hypothetical protein J3Q66DRAFT_434754 [Benniella sp.]|nr:MAG: hypothetical protein J3Q66DRAFT_434754 [Benniella sp.]
MTIGTLAILKAGGAYISLDPAYASDRLNNILVAAVPSIVIADASARMVPGEALTCLTVVDPDEIRDTYHAPERNHVESIVSRQLVRNPQVPGLTPS